MSLYRYATSTCYLLPGQLPGDLPYEDTIAAMIRVNHAGETGAEHIYTGQLRATKSREFAEHVVAELHTMLRQEQEHRQYFIEQLRARRVRPSALHMAWCLGGWLMGWLTAFGGLSCAMICTEAVEDVIDYHYREQLLTLQKYSSHLKGRDTDLSRLIAKIEQFRLEELEHKHLAQEYNTDKHGGPLYRAIQRISKVAIAVAKIL